MNWLDKIQDDDLDKLNQENQDKEPGEFRELNDKIYEYYDSLVRKGCSSGFFEGLCNMCKSYPINGIDVEKSDFDTFDINDLKLIKIIKCDHNGHSFFEEATSLRQLGYFENLTEIGCGAFINCKQLKEIPLPSHLKKIGIKAFSGSGIKSIKIPSGVEEIPCGAFDCCKDLEEIKIPTSVKKISKKLCFYGCTSLKKITLPGIFKKEIDEILFNLDRSKIQISWI